MAKNVMVVESPNKMKTIQPLLPPGWKVLASSGHIRDLDEKELSIDLTSFALKYVLNPGKTINGRKLPSGRERIARIQNEIKDADMVWLATDPDREGEAIAWHLKESLKLSETEYQRITFNLLDKESINQSIASPRKIDTQLVRAQEARRALDRLIGYTVSSLISNKLGDRLSAGRVQSPSLRYVVEREREIRNFKEVKHFGAELIFDNEAWTAQWQSKPCIPAGQSYNLDRGLAERAAAVRKVTVKDAKSGIAKESPPAPFTTSTMLQAASVALKFDPEKTMSVAQKLFEGGAITYHRADSSNLSEKTIIELRQFAESQGLPLPEAHRRFESKENAQEAHEAIRPKHFEDRNCGTSEDERALYNLIWERAVACQLADSQFRVNRLLLEGEHEGKIFHYMASGRVLIVKGWRELTARAAEHDEEAGGRKDKSDDRESGAVPKANIGDTLTVENGRVLDKKTTPPKRYTAATLVKKLDDEGIGRPSTYAAIMQNITKRGYVKVEQRYLVPTPLGERLVDGLIDQKFSFVDPTFTRSVEARLDQITQGKDTYINVVKDSWETLDKEAAALGGARSAFEKRDKAPDLPVDENGEHYPCPKCGKHLKRVRKRDNTFFWSCSTWQASGCDGTMNDVNGKPVAQERQTNTPPTDERGNPYPCPLCGSPLNRIERKDHSGFFWSCSTWRNSGCNGTLDDDNGKPTGIKKKEWSL